jgi:hypothetical protein
VEWEQKHLHILPGRVVIPELCRLLPTKSHVTTVSFILRQRLVLRGQSISWLIKAPEVSKHPPSITTCPAPAAWPMRWVPVLSAPCGPTPSFVASPRTLKISQFRSRSILPDGTSTWLLVPPCPIASGIRRICHHGIDAESPGSHSPDELQQESACSPCHIIRKLRDLGL